MDVSIIIVNYNTCQVTNSCLESIFDKTNNVSFEVILIDNNSKDQSFSVFSKDKRIKYIYQNKNLGFGNANNIGYKYARGKYLFLLNSDTLLKSNVVKEFYDFMEGMPSDIACVGTMLKDYYGNFMTSYNTFPTLWTGLDWFTLIGPIFKKTRIVKPEVINVINNIQVVDFVSGADIFMRKEVADKCGLFDSDFFMYFEETEMQYRYRRNGYKSLIFPKPQIIHLEGYSTNKLYSSNFFQKKLLLLNSYYLYLKKTRRKSLYYIFRILFAITCPLWFIHPKFKLRDKLFFIKYAYK